MTPREGSDDADGADSGAAPGWGAWAPRHPPDDRRHDSRLPPGRSAADGADARPGSPSPAGHQPDRSTRAPWAPTAWQTPPSTGAETPPPPPPQRPTDPGGAATRSGAPTGSTSGDWRQPPTGWPGPATAPPFPGPTPSPIPERRSGGTLRGVLIGALVGAIVAAVVATMVTVAVVDDSSGEAVPPPRRGGALDIGGLLDVAGPSVVSIETGERQSVFGGAGSGFVISSDGLVVTNAHVIAGRENIQVIFADGSSEPAELVGSFPDDDVAMVRVDREGLVPAELGSSSAMEVGDQVVAIGNALGLGGDPSVTFGILSAKDRDIRAQNLALDDLLQTDAAINPGNSGGPLLNRRGEVVGINTAVIPNAQNINFAISIDSVRGLIDELEAGNGAINPDDAFLGVRSVTVDDLSEDQRSQLDVSATDGAVIVEVVEDSPAEAAGFEAGDVLTGLGDRTVSSSGDLADILESFEPGDGVSVDYERGDDERSEQVTLDRRGG